MTTPPATTPQLQGSLPHWETLPRTRRRRSSRSRPRYGSGSPPPAGRWPTCRRGRGVPRRSRRHPGDSEARRGGLADHRLRRHRGGHRQLRRLARQAPGLRGGARALPRDLAEQWDRDIVEYVDSNQFFENYAGPADDFFGDLEGRSRDLSRLLVTARRWRPVSTHGWPRRSRSLTPSGPPRRTGIAGSTRTVTRSTPTGSAAGRRARTRPVWAPTWTPAPWTCG